MEQFGVSFTAKQCQNFGVSPTDCLDWLIDSCGFKRFRLTSFWNEIEATPGEYDFTRLDEQIKQIEAGHGTISLCLGAKQPRWPETHWPDWAWKLSKPERTKALLQFLDIVVRRYKNHACIVSYQLENEALLHFGERNEIDRSRLRAEFALVKKLDPFKPIIMTTSSSWGIPMRQPIPDIVGFSYYRVLYRADLKKYTTALHQPWIDRLRALAIRLIWRRHSFIHELQLEPWGPQNIWEMTVAEQNKSMSTKQIAESIQLAQKTALSPIDLWGGEWWYWRKQQGDPSIIEAVIRACDSDDTPSQ